MVNFAIRHDSKANLRFAPLQSRKGQMLIHEYHVPPSADTVVLIDGGRAYTYANAAIRICKYLDWPQKLMYALVIIPSFISQPFYKWFAKRRYRWFGRKDACMIPGPGVRERFLE